MTPHFTQSMHRSVSVLTAWLLATSIGWAAPNAAPLPTVRAEGAAFEWRVDNRPFIALGGEVHNSSASDPTAIEQAFERAAKLNLNTVITPAYWELMEPIEGRFDFKLIDAQLKQARARNLRIVLLWFGTLKNAHSTYAPAWVLSDRQRFPRAQLSQPVAKQRSQEPALSVFGPNTLAADARAFSHLMAHLARVDPQHTVIAVQVENESGLLGDSRDRSAVAEQVWQQPVPATLLARLQARRDRLQPALAALWARQGHRTSGTWQEVFGADWQADEAFMAWGVSRFIDAVAAAGQQRLRLPMYTNAWLGPQQPDDPAGAYPSGGPVPRVFDIWQATAPHLDWLSPDIYVDNFSQWASAYARPDQPLFIPEARFVAGNLFEALGSLRAIGFGPFGIEDGVPGNQIAQAYGQLRGMVGLVAAAQAQQRIAGMALAPEGSHTVTFGEHRLTVRSAQAARRTMLLDLGVHIPDVAPQREPQARGAVMADLTDTRPMGLVIQLDRDEFIVVGQDLDLRFTDARTGEARELAQVQEGRYVNERWQPGRVLNGDERLMLLPADAIGTIRIKLARPLR